MWAIYICAHKYDILTYILTNFCKVANVSNIDFIYLFISNLNIIAQQIKNTPQPKGQNQCQTLN